MFIVCFRLLSAPGAMREMPLLLLWHSYIVALPATSNSYAVIAMSPAALEPDGTIPESLG
jgi:hypothetical protein